MEKFYITTPIYYVNAIPTVGSAYTTVIGDVLARWHRLNNDKVFYLTGLDENSLKTVKAAKEQGYKDIQKYTDDMAQKWKDAWKILNISYDGFIRTTEPRHKKVVNEVFMKIYKKSDIYKGTYEGLYCEGCEAFVTEKDLVNGKCLLHQKQPKKISEENYFFKLTKYKDKVLQHIKKNPEFILPETRRKEVISFIESELKDISISRPNVGWGIKLPIDEKQYFWVWLDALCNYISGAKNYWPAELHLLAKDILRFHCILWPAFLFSANLPLPKQLFVHGFLTINGKKMSKSLGNAIDPLYLADKYSADVLRYYLARSIPFGEDGDFNESDLKERLNSELADKLGNLISRVAALAEKYSIKKCENKLIKKLKLKEIQKAMNNYQPDKALSLIFSFIDECNFYTQNKKPWETHDQKVLYGLADSIKAIAILLWPFMPETCEKIAKQFNFEINIKTLKEPIKENKIKRSDILFKKI